MTKEIFEAGFAGFFLAMAFVYIVAGMLSRSVASGAYAAIMLVVVGIELYSIPHGIYGGQALHAALLSAYFVAVVGFAFVLLRSLRYDTLFARITIGVLACNVILVFAEDLSVFWRTHYYGVDQIALDALIVMLVVLGVRAMEHEQKPIPAIYLAALLGPAVGLVLNDLSNNGRLPFSLWLLFTFDFGVLWESLFFAFAVALRNRGIQMERDRFERLAYVDPLTGVANRRTFDETLERMWNVARRARVPIAVAMVDIDFFKRLNDTRGHQVGDECLRRVAALCSSALRRAGDCFARYGGEEFAAILVNTNTEHALRLADHMRRVVEADGGITISVGVSSSLPAADGNPLSLVAAADEALYRAKNEGRNCVRAAQPRAELAQKV